MLDRMYKEYPAGEAPPVLEALAANPAARATIGAANRARAEADYDEAAMVSAYARVYGNAMGRRSFP